MVDDDGRWPCIKGLDSATNGVCGEGLRRLLERKYHLHIRFCDTIYDNLMTVTSIIIEWRLAMLKGKIRTSFSSKLVPKSCDPLHNCKLPKLYFR